MRSPSATFPAILPKVVAGLRVRPISFGEMLEAVIVHCASDSDAPAATVRAYATKAINLLISRPPARRKQCPGNITGGNMTREAWETCCSLPITTLENDWR